MSSALIPGRNGRGEREQAARSLAAEREPVRVRAPAAGILACPGEDRERVVVGGREPVAGRGPHPDHDDHVPGALDECAGGEVRGVEIRRDEAASGEEEDHRRILRVLRLVEPPWQGAGHALGRDELEPRYRQVRVR